jgi:hypothetical protein
MQDNQTRSVSEKFFKTKNEVSEEKNSSKKTITENDSDSDIEDDDETTHTKEIVYLDQEILSMNFGDFIDTDNTYTINIGIYRINNNDLSIPFLEFLLDTSGEYACFPNILNFNCPSNKVGGNQNVDSQNNNDDTTEHTHFMNECLGTLLDTFPKLNIRNFVYKGYQEDQDNIFVIFEFNTSIVFELPSLLSWGILDEIMYRKQFKNKQIEPKISQFFINNPHMTNLHYSGDNDILPFPFLAYLCRDNLYNIEVGESILDSTYSHPWLGDFHYFSSYPLESNKTDVTLLQRYAIFTVEPAKYLWKDISTISQEQKEEFTKKIQDVDVVTLYFHENNIQYWCIRNVANILKLQ